MASQKEGYSVGILLLNSKGFRVLTGSQGKVQDCLTVNFLENQANQKKKKGGTYQKANRVIGTNGSLENKRDERGTIIKNKARLVAQGYRQEEGVDYDEVFCTVALN
ncbi:copia protein [Tanacetum coccineum]|uniref:Copia protein n=1 Tax=Tanacetum coccineum TaxID=301880 RepID=A0ABQ5HUT4_9ASTR